MFSVSGTYRKMVLILDSMVVLSTVLLVGTLSVSGLRGVQSTALVNLFLHFMHYSFIAAVPANAFLMWKEKRVPELVLTISPFIVFLISVVLRAAGTDFPATVFIIFDFYLILWFFFLFIKEAKTL